MIARIKKVTDNLSWMQENFRGSLNGLIDKFFFQKHYTG